MNKLILAFLMFALPLFATIKWDKTYHFSLKKDQIATILFYKKDDPKPYEFKFRWTLYAGNQVIVLSNYRGFPRQHTLFFKANLNSFRQSLISEKLKHSLTKTYLLLTMNDFDEKKKSINFTIYIRDSYKRFEVT